MKFAEILWILAILLCVVALFKIVSAQIALNALVVSIAIFSLMWIGIARKHLSRKSSLAAFASVLFFSIIFFMLASVLTLLIEIFAFSTWITLVSYAISAVAYLLLVISAYKLMRIGKEFGFVIETAKIKKILRDKKAKLRVKK